MTMLAGADFFTSAMLNAFAARAPQPGSKV